MPVVLDKGKKSGHLKCEVCEKKSATYKASSPAAPDLTICEEANKDAGWAYNIGFFAMMIGHRTLCPDCASTSGGQFPEENND